MITKLILLLVLFSDNLYAKSYTEKVNDAFKEAAEKYEIDEATIRAICWVESKHKTYAYRPNDHADGTSAFGICQILYTTGKTLGIEDEKCLDGFKPNDWKNNQYKNCKLFGLKTNIFAASRYLKRKLDRYEGDYTKAIAAYNAGSYRICPADGWQYYKGERYRRCEPGGPLNIQYIRDVEQAIREKR